MQIPTRFKLAGYDWRVIHQADLVEYGRTHPDGMIVLNGSIKTQQVKEQTFCHELVHAILFMMGDPGPHDEKWVDAFGHLLHQYINTAK